MACAWAVGPLARADDHGDSFDAATYVSLPSETAGTIDTDGDKDYFRFDVPTSRDVTVETIGSPSQDLDYYTLVSLYGEDGSEIEVGGEGDTHLDSRIQRYLEAGTYYVSVGGYGTGSYVLHLRDHDSEVDDDHADSSTWATRVSLPSEMAGDIESGGDTDWFRFEVSGEEVIAETTGRLDTVGTLYDASGNELAANDDSVPGTNSNFRIQRYLEAGTYYVRVASFGSDTGSYVLRVHAKDYHGNSIASATLVSLPSVTRGAIYPESDTDLFQFEVPAAGAEIVAETTGSLDTVGALYDADGELAANDDSVPGTNFNFRIQRYLEAGTYYLLVDPLKEVRWRSPRWRRSRIGSYVLHLHVADQHVLVGDGHGDSASSAHTVSLPSETAGAIDPGRDVDWFQFEVSASGDVTAETTGSLDTVGTLYDMGGNELAANDDAVPGANFNFRIWRSLRAGIYRLRVTSFGSAVGDYALSLQFEAGARTNRTGDVGLRNLGDFDGDGKDDVLLRHEDGRWHYYPMDGRSVLAGGGAPRLTQNLAWQVAGIGDFDGDGKDDVLMRHRNGRWRYYRMDGYQVLVGGGGASITADLAWRLAGVGDFDGDGRHDVLLRHEDGRWHYYPMQGRTVLAGAGAVDLAHDTSERIAGIGDLNGDGRADVLARRANGIWYYYALDGVRELPAAGELALSSDLAWRALSRGTGPTEGTPLQGLPLTLGQDETVDLAEAFVDDQALTYETRSSNTDVVRVGLTGGVLTLMPVAEGTAAVMVTAHDPDGNSATQTFAVTVGESAAELAAGTTFRDCAECPLMVSVPAGKFTMGSPSSEVARYEHEGPQHEVSVPAFAAGIYEVTFAEWDACKADGGCRRLQTLSYVRRSGDHDHPAIVITWDQVQQFVDWLSYRSGHSYRLLTESEWEYAARAGTTTPFHTGGTITPQQANFDGRRGEYPSDDYDEARLYRGQTVPVGSFAPNAFGLYDMHGNVWEWVQDCYFEDYVSAPTDGSAAERDNCGAARVTVRVIRGGSFDYGAAGLRSAFRWGVDDVGGDNIGFRVARALKP